MAVTSDIPEGWKRVRLGSVSEVNPRRPRLHVKGRTPVSFLPMAAISENCEGIWCREVRPYSDVSRGYTYFEKNDVLFAKITPCLQNGKHALATDLKGGFGFGTTEFHVVRAGPSIEPAYLFCILTYPPNVDRCKNQFRGTAGQQRIHPETLRALVLLLPPLAEQRAIAAVLNSIDEAIERTEVLIAATENLRESLRHELLTRGIPGWHSEYKEVPRFGSIPASWEVVRLGDVSEVNPRRPRLRVNNDTPVPFLPMAAISENCEGILRREVRPYFDVCRGYTYFEENDVLFAKITPVCRTVNMLWLLI